MPSLLKKPTVSKGKKKALSFVVDCSKPVDDSIMDIGAFETFLSERIKVNGKAGTCSSLHLLLLD
jgi:large subunit ribosomal protein L22e